MKITVIALLITLLGGGKWSQWKVSYPIGVTCGVIQASVLSQSYS